MPRIRFRQDQLSNWKKANPVLSNNEVVIVHSDVDPNNPELDQYAKGDGKSDFNSLPKTDTLKLPREIVLFNVIKKL